MKRTCVLVVLALAAGPVLAADAPGGVKAGDKPVIQWATTTGQRVDAEALKGYIIIVDFWATWCGPCMAEADHMVKLSKEYGPKGVQIVGVSLDDSAADMAKAASRVGFTWPQVCDGGGWKSPVAKAWGVRSIPATFILSPEGEVVWRGHPGNIDKPLADAVAKYPTVAAQRAQAMETVDQAEKLLADKSFDQAMAKLESLGPAMQTDAAVLAKIRAAAGKLKLAGADQEAYDKAADAHAAAAKLLGKSGAKPAPAAPAPADAATVDARLKAADKLRDAGDNAGGYRAYKWIVEHAPADAPAATAAGEKVKAYEADAAFMASLKQGASAGEARSALSLGKNYLMAGKRDLAKQQFEKVIKGFPDSPEAAEAKAALAKMGE